MARGKSQYNFTISAEPAAINQMILDYLRAGGFVQKQKDGVGYYERYDAITGRRLFEYSITGSQVTIWAYLGSFKHPQDLTGVSGVLEKQSYKESLQLLFRQMEALGQGDRFTGGEVQGNQIAQTSAAMQSFEEQNKKSLDTATIVGFIISLVGVLLAFVGFVYGAVLLFVEYYLGIKGLKSNHKGLAVTTIVLASLSILIVIVEAVILGLAA